MISQIDKNILKEVYGEFKRVSVGEKAIFLPKTINKKLAYLLGVLHGDGHLHKNKKFVTITTESKDYLEKIIIPIIQEIFGTNSHISSFGTYHRAEIGSKPINSFLSLFCPVGKKKGLLRIPKKFLSQNIY